MQHKHYRFATYGGIAMLIAAFAAQPMVAALAGDPSSAAAAVSKTVTAVKVDSVSEDPAAAYWAKAPVVTSHTVTTVKGRADGPDVSVQAVYDGKNLALRIVWADKTASVLHRAWVWDGSKFSRSDEMQDRMAVMFPIENNAKFSTKGCGAACHNEDKDNKKWWMGSDSASVRYDLWQWSAANSNPAGQAQDQWVGKQEDPTNHESALHGDALKSGGSIANINKDKNGPAYMNGTSITATQILTGQQVAIDTSKLTKGAMIPSSIVAPWVGSRGDIKAKGVWKNGKWTVVLMRALSTGNDDDLTLTPPKAYPLGVAVFDHADQVDHTVMPDVMTLKWQ